jgi:uncharacterized membrane protein YgcG
MAVSLQIATADVDATRSEVGPHRPPAASADVEVAVMMMAVVVMTVVVVMAVTVVMMTMMMAVMAMTVMTTMTVATLATSRSRRNSSSGQSDRGSGCKSDFTEHICSLHCARRDCLMRL